MKLIYEQTGKEVAVGDVVTLKNKGDYTVTIIQKPHKPSSTGRVYIRPVDGEGADREYFPSVIGAKWIEREDQEPVRRYIAMNTRLNEIKRSTNIIDFVPANLVKEALEEIKQHGVYNYENTVIVDETPEQVETKRPVTKHALWMQQAGSFNFELDEDQLLDKALDSGFVQKVSEDQYLINEEY